MKAIAKYLLFQLVDGMANIWMVKEEQNLLRLAYGVAHYHRVLFHSVKLFSNTADIDRGKSSGGEAKALPRIAARLSLLGCHEV
jgi:hypothetical protein